MEYNIIDIDWSSYFKKLYPNIGKMYFSQSEMRNVNKRLTARNKRLMIEKTKYHTTIYDLLVRVIMPEIGNQQEKKIAADLLKSLDQWIGELIELLNKDSMLINQLKSQLADLFNDNEAKYLEKIGELLSTIHLIKKFPLLTLKSLIYKYERVNGSINSKGKDADILFNDSINNSNMLIDILNISLNFKKIENEEGLESYIYDRVQNKIISKGFEKEELKEFYKERMIQPFIWIYDIDTIRKYKSSFEKKISNQSLPILLLRQSSNANDEVYYDCCEASNL